MHALVHGHFLSNGEPGRWAVMWEDSQKRAYVEREEGLSGVDVEGGAYIQFGASVDIEALCNTDLVVCELETTSNDAVSP